MSQKRGDILRKIGYIRVSSASQNPSRQFQQLNEIGMDIIFEEKFPDQQRIVSNFKNVRGFTEGDIIYVTDLTRITRSTQDLFELIDIIRSKKQV